MMTTQKGLRSKRKKDLLLELNCFSSGVWLLSLMSVILSILSASIFYIFDIPQDLYLVYIFVSVMCGVFIGWSYLYGRWLILRYRSRKLFLYVNRGIGERVLLLGHELGLRPGNGYGAYQFRVLRRLVECCSAKEFAEFLCRLLYLESVMYLKESGNGSYREEDAIEKASSYLFSNPGRGRGLAECIVLLSEKSHYLSPRKYVSQFLEGLYSTRHLVLANNFIKAIDTALEEKRDARIARSVELERSRSDSSVEREERRELKFFFKMVGSLRK